MPKQGSKGKVGRATAANGPREVLYPTYEIRTYSPISGNPLLTVQDCKDYMGWQEETDQQKFGSDYLLVDRHGRKVRCAHNVTNRPLYRTVYEGLMQKILNRRWRFNSEPCIISVHGDVLNGQHTFIAVVLAEQERLLQEAHWRTLWTGPVTIEKNVCVGQPDDDDVVNTMDTCKPRTISDVLYRSAFFASYGQHDRRVVARMADYAIRLVWARTGYADRHGFNAFSPMRTHEEAIDLLARHPRLMETISHIHIEDAGKNRQISRYVSPGDAAGMMYLMAATGSDGNSYRNEEPRPSEASLGFDHWDKAAEFWVLLGSGATAFDNVRDALALAVDPDRGGGGRDAKLGVLVKAWEAFLTGTAISKGDVKLERARDGDGVLHLAEFPVLSNGIDVSERWDGPEPGDADAAQVEEDVRDATEEIEQRAAEVREENGHGDTTIDDESPAAERARREKVLKNGNGDKKPAREKKPAKETKKERKSAGSRGPR